MAAHDPYRVAKVVLFFYNEVCILTIMHTTTSGNTIATRALRCFSHHDRSSNKLTEEHFLRAHSAGLSLQKIRPVDTTAAYRGSACSPIRGEQGAYIYRECVYVHERGSGEGGSVYGSLKGHGYSHAPHDLFPRRSTAYHLSTYVDFKSLHVDPTDYVRRSIDHARGSRISTTTPWLLLWEKASLSRLGHSFSSARQSLMLRISIFACKLSVVCPYVKGAPDSSLIENTYL